MNVIELLEEVGVQPKRVASSRGGEYHSRCPDPNCDGHDRFCAWPKDGCDGRYWCRKCLRSGDAIQFCRDFLGLDFQSACARVGRQPVRQMKNLSVPTKEKFVPKLLSEPPEKWRKRAFALVYKSHQYLLAHPHLLNQDKDRGLNKQSIIDFQLGWNPTNIFEPRELWGIGESSAENGERLLCIPKGIVIPSFRENHPIRVKIRRNEWQPEDKYPKYHIIAGGMTCPSLYGGVRKSVVLVEAELDAMLIQKFAADICCCIALGGVSIKPDVIIDQVLRQASSILFALDFDDSGKKAYNFWQSTYPHMKPWPVPKGKSPGDAYSIGVDLRLWIEAGLKGNVL